MMAIFYFQGNIALESFKIFCADNLVARDKAVFIFPGNASHHTASHNLYSIKDGSGLANIARQLGEKGYPVLSLPTTGMEDWSISSTTQKLVDNAIADLWRAIGAGFDLILPVREHSGTKYFSNPINDSIFEPSFWGGIQIQANKNLADYYILHLSLLQEFLGNNEINLKKEFLKNLPMGNNNLVIAYNAGKSMSLDDLWLVKK
jgi:hypothetical protein